MTRLTKTKIRVLPAGTVKGDGGNLWIASGKTGRKTWQFRHTYHGKRRCMGLGPWPEVSLVEARDKAYLNRKRIVDGIIHSLDADHPTAASYRYGFRGNRRFLQLLADFSGTHGSGTPIAAIAIKGASRLAPQD